MIKAVLDTNTLISAIGWRKGNPRKVLEFAIKDKFQLITSIDLMEEFHSVINREKFAFLSKEEKSEFLVYLIQIAHVVESNTKLSVVKEDPKDDIVLEAALEGKVDYIISGDNHLLKLKAFRGIKIITAKEFLDKVGWGIYRNLINDGVRKYSYNGLNQLVKVTNLSDITLEEYRWHPIQEKIIDHIIENKERYRKIIESV